MNLDVSLLLTKECSVEVVTLVASLSSCWDRDLEAAMEFISGSKTKLLGFTGTMVQPHS